MADGTAIEWADATWNPVTGCSRISAGCDNCYALTLARRLKAMGNPRYQTDGDPERGSGPGFGVTCHRDLLDVPQRLRRPRRIFVCSMADLFHVDVPTSFIMDVFRAMRAAHQHTFLVLTKRSKRARRLAARGLLTGEQTPMRRHVDAMGHVCLLPDRPPRSVLPPNVWFGVSVEDQSTAWRIRDLASIPAVVRFVSAEPLLGPLDLLSEMPDAPELGLGPDAELIEAVDWLIVGGESGLNARPMAPEWVDSLLAQCRAAQPPDLPFFFKQWGGRTPKANGRLLNGRTYDEFPDLSGGEVATMTPGDLDD